MRGGPRRLTYTGYSIELTADVDHAYRVMYRHGLVCVTPVVMGGNRGFAFKKIYSTLRG